MPRDLDEYRRKRDFGKTTEPAAAEPDPNLDRPIFVIHRHEASRLHYDLRLQMEGVLKSFAIPKGFSYHRRDKHLAVRTEDHPLEYYDFHGVIPAGEYGAGTMRIWDRGTYELLNIEPTEEGIAVGEIKMLLHGKRVRGEWHMVKTKRSEKEWLIFKGKDLYAREAEEPPYPFDVDLEAAVRKPSPKKRRPMTPAEIVAPFNDRAFVFELEFAGIRAFARKVGDEVKIRDAGSGRLVKGALDEVAREIRGVHARNAIFDGVLVALDAGGRPSREALTARLADEEAGALFYYAFDFLHYDDWQLHKLPLMERKRLLTSILVPSQRLLYVDHILGDGEKLAATVSATGLSGVIAKRAASQYTGGPSDDWLRIAADGEGAGGEDNFHKALESVTIATPSRVEFTNRDKIFWPEMGLTKGDMIDYYARVADVLLPHLAERPIHMQRFPDGIHGKAFYHKDAPDHIPDWVETETIESSEKKMIRYIVVNDRDTLLLLANLGSIDLHPWMSRRGSLENPDWFVIDLDPKTAPFSDVLRIARATGRLLRGIGLTPYLKTSGKTGLHITVPLIPGYTYEFARMFAEMVARAIVREHPDIATVERSVARRGGRVYIDYLQNAKGQTVVPPFVPRPVESAGVSMPLDWDELNSDLDPARFNILTAPQRIAERGDLFRGVLTNQQDLVPALAAFQEHFG